MVYLPFPDEYERAAQMARGLIRIGRSFNSGAKLQMGLHQAFYIAQMEDYIRAMKASGLKPTDYVRVVPFTPEGIYSG